MGYSSACKFLDPLAPKKWLTWPRRGKSEHRCLETVTYPPLEARLFELCAAPLTS